MRFEVTLYCIIDILCFFMNNIFVLFVLNIETCSEETEAYCRSIYAVNRGDILVTSRFAEYSFVAVTISRL